MANNRQTQKGAEAQAELNRAEALRMYLLGKPYRQVAKDLGVSVSTAHGYIKHSLEEAAQRRRELADELLEAQVERIREAMDRITSSDGYVNGDPQSVNTYLKACESLRKLLGLDQPSRVDVTSDGEAVKGFIGIDLDEV